MTTRWLTILGIGEDGTDGLSSTARALLGAATFVMGGARHLALAHPLIRGEAQAWPSPIEAAVPILLARRPAPVVVLASGDPHCFGIASVLARHVALGETLCLPAPSAFSLACAHLGWALQDCATISFCGRPIEALAPLLQPGARVLALCAGVGTPGAVAGYLVARGFGAATLHLLEALGGGHERLRASSAAAFDCAGIGPLATLAIDVACAPGAMVIPLAAGLPDAVFDHDGQITKSEIRAITLAALAPRRGERLWDIGCGSGSVGIEWMLRHPANHAIGIEQDPARAARAAANAARLGVPGLAVATGTAPGALAGLAPPHAVFIGGGAHQPGLLDAAWQALPPDGRLVANAVTVESEAALLAARLRFGGTLARLSVERLDAVGRFSAFRPAMTVTQFVAVKP